MAEISQQMVKKLASQIAGKVTGPLSGQLWSVTNKALRSTEKVASRAWVNLVLPQIIPFNKPLGLKLVSLTENQSEVILPFKNATQNHLGGLHACALVTAGEYTAGLLLLRRVNPSQYRIILKELEAKYSKQGRDHALARAIWPTSAELKFDEGQSSTDITLTTLVEDKSGSILAEVTSHWQVKAWSSVRKK